MDFSIIIPSYNRWDLLDKCLSSIIKNTDLSRGEVIVISNGCIDNTPNLVKIHYPNVKCVHWEQPLGYPKAINAGIAFSSGDIIILLNNDTVLLDNTWYNKLTEPFRNSNITGITGLIKRHQNCIPWVLFFCAAIKREVVLEIGYLDETFTTGCGEDIDYCIKAYKARFDIIQVPEVNLNVIEGTNKVGGPFPIFHEGGATVSKNPNQEITYRKNMEIIKKRYGE